MAYAVLSKDLKRKKDSFNEKEQHILLIDRLPRPPGFPISSDDYSLLLILPITHRINKKWNKLIKRILTIG